MIMAKKFEKSFTLQEPIPEEAISRAIEVMRSGRLHRYNSDPGEISETSKLEKDFAGFQGASYCLAVASGGQALQIALRAAGVSTGTKVLANAYTLAPVPGAIHAAGGEPVFIEIGDDWHTDIADLEEKANSSGAKFFMLSHMRGHVADMDEICRICNKLGILIIEDCAHTMGAKWKGKRSGNFGAIACFSTQTYKHLNSGEGGLLTTNDKEIAARATMLSGSYMLHSRHGAGPPPDTYKTISLQTPNCSARMDNLRAAILHVQLATLSENIQRWNERYKILEHGLGMAPGIKIVERKQHEEFVGSSIQFHTTGIDKDLIPKLVENCRARGVEIKWFGADEPDGFTSRYDSWHYLGNQQHLPQTLKALSTTCDMRIPLTFTQADCRDIAGIIAEETTALIAVTTRVS